MSKFYYLVHIENPNGDDLWGETKCHSLKGVKHILDNQPWKTKSVYKVTKGHYQCIFDYNCENNKIYVDTKQLYGKYIPFQI